MMCSQHAAMVVHFKLRMRDCCCGSCPGVWLACAVGHLPTAVPVLHVRTILYLLTINSTKSPRLASDMHHGIFAATQHRAACSESFPLLECFRSDRRDSIPLKYGASGVKGAEPSFTEHLATEKGQAELRAFVRRVDDRVQQDWITLPPHLRGGAVYSPQACVCTPVSSVRSSTCICYSQVQFTRGV